jgi:hypothetical protein
MRLSEQEYIQYLDIHPRLIYYVGQKKKLLPSTTSFEQFMDFPVEDKFPIRNALYDNIHLTNQYIKENDSILSEEDKDIIRDFKYFKRGTFYVVKMLKKHAHFLGDEFVYGVTALSDPFQDLIGGVPIAVQAVLLPFRGKIIYDGILSGYPVYFGGGMKKSIKNNYDLAKGKYGIVTTLPEEFDKEQLADTAEKQLKVLMKTKSSREYNWYEIEQLLQDNPKLESVYTQEWGRINARAKKKQLKALGISNYHFAIYDDTIVASGASKAAVTATVKKLVKDAKQRSSIYYFKV